MHIELDDDLVERVDAVAGPRGRSRFVREAIERALEWKNRWDLFESAVGSIPDHGHEWDDDPAEWVRRQRFSDPRQVG
jgi:predicted DNA-binding protein